jgi:microcystin-dependent protein
MGIEAATWIQDLVPANPGSSDLPSQGDDHIRLIKQVLQNSFPGSSKAYYSPTMVPKSSGFTVVAADQNKTFLVDTSAGQGAMTLPSLAVADAGWECFMIKTTQGINAVFIYPPTGTLTSGSIPGLAYARRCIPGARIRCSWSGTSWFVSRAEGVGGPVGACIEFHGASLPFGYEWPSGQVLATSYYLEYAAVMGTYGTYDRRGFVGIARDNLGGVAAGRLPGGIINGSVQGAVGGSDTRSLVTANLPAYTPSGSVFNGAITSTFSVKNGQIAINNTIGGGSIFFGGSLAVELIQGTVTSSQAASGFGGNPQGGSSQAFGTLQPSMMVNVILIVE